MVGGVVVVQTNFHVKPTTKLLWVAFGLGCCCLAWLWGYDNVEQGHADCGGSQGLGLPGNTSALTSV